MQTIAEKALAEMFIYLDNLRESSMINMFGAAPYVADNFNKDRRQANKVVAAWRTTFDGTSTAAERAATALKNGEMK